MAPGIPALPAFPTRSFLVCACPSCGLVKRTLRNGGVRYGVGSALRMVFSLFSVRGCFLISNKLNETCRRTIRFLFLICAAICLLVQRLNSSYELRCNRRYVFGNLMPRLCSGIWRALHQRPVDARSFGHFSWIAQARTDMSIRGV
jgi:hypothetical protein